MSVPIVSVVIPVHNGARYLAEAIESVLRQRQEGLELIVIDDGSTDGSADVARRHSGVRCHVQARGGSGAARNAGVALSRGGLLAFLDADDRWVDGKLSRQLAVVRRSSGVDGVFGFVSCFASPELTREEAARVHVPSGVLTGPTVGTMLIRREAFDHVGPFETGVRVGEFIDWYARAVDAGLTLVVMPDVLLHRRIHTTNTSRLTSEAGSELLRVLKSSLDRRRTAADR